MNRDVISVFVVNGGNKQYAGPFTYAESKAFEIWLCEVINPDWHITVEWVQLHRAITEGFFNRAPLMAKGPTDE